jgi:retinol dehydrogenase 12
MSDNTKIILVTGATSGIGKATVEELVKVATTLILPVRTIAKGEELRRELQLINTNCQIDIYSLQLNSLESVKNFAKNVLDKYPVIDVLINNAGIFNSSRVMTEDNIEETFQVNVLSQFILNNMLLPLLKASNQGRIINLSSMGHYSGKFNIDNIQNQNDLKNNIGLGTQIYFNSNLYRNLLTFKQAEELKGTKVTVNCLHPGIIRSALGHQIEGFWAGIIKNVSKYMTQSPQKGAKTSIYLATETSIADVTGKYWTDSKVKEPLAICNNQEYQNQLWDYCTKVSKL